MDSRHDNDTEVKPVPGVPQKGEGPHTETSCQDLYERLKGIDTGEGVPGGRRKKGKKMKTRPGMGLGGVNAKRSK